MTLTWKKCGDDSRWCSFEDLVIDHRHDVSGVYVIFGISPKITTVYVGSSQTSVGDRILDHRNDSRILKYANMNLKVTRADLSSYQVHGAERYLANVLRPLVGDSHPDIPPMQVNLPF